MFEFRARCQQVQLTWQKVGNPVPVSVGNLVQDSFANMFGRMMFPKASPQLLLLKRLLLFLNHLLMNFSMIRSYISSDVTLTYSVLQPQSISISFVNYSTLILTVHSLILCVMDCNMASGLGLSRQGLTLPPLSTTPVYKELPTRNINCSLKLNEMKKSACFVSHLRLTTYYLE